MGWAEETKHRGESKPLSEEAELTLNTQQLRFLARQIHDEAQFQTILRTVEDAVMRLEMERLLRPMLLFKIEPVREPIIMCSCEDWLTCAHPWPAMFRVRPVQPVHPTSIREYARDFMEKP